jgi:hypothetical protein
VQKYMFTRGSHLREALLHPASRLDDTVQHFDAGWSSPVARQAHNLKVVSSNLAPATKIKARYLDEIAGFSVSRDYALNISAMR